MTRSSVEGELEAEAESSTLRLKLGGRLEREHSTLRLKLRKASEAVFVPVDLR
jgi:hypothetical protein